MELPKDLIQSIGALNGIVAQQQDSAAAMLYRLMFRHERNIDILDRYADQVLDGVRGMGSQYAEEDYRNYLQYLKVVVPSCYEGHKEMFEEDLKMANDDVELEDD